MFSKLQTLSVLILIQFVLVGNGFAKTPSTSVVGIKTVSYMDTDRQRPLLLDLYYPVDDGVKGDEVPGIMMQAKQANGAPVYRHEGKKLPLIILCHGYGGSRKHLTWMAESLAKAGYVVAAMEIYGNTDSYDTPEVALQRWIRPLDVTASLDKILQDPEWSEIIDPSQIGFAGFSLGGLAGVWLAGGLADQFETPNVKSSSIYELAVGAQQHHINAIDYSKAGYSYRDGRIKAFFLMAPAHGKAFSSDGLKDVNLPIHIVVGEADKIAPLKENAQHFATQLPNAKLTIIPGKVGHLAFRNKIQEKKKSCASGRDFDLSKDSQIDYVHSATSDLALKFFKLQLK